MPARLEDLVKVRSQRSERLITLAGQAKQIFDHLRDIAPRFYEENLHGPDSFEPIYLLLNEPDFGIADYPDVVDQEAYMLRVAGAAALAYDVAECVRCLLGKHDQAPESLMGVDLCNVDMILNQLGSKFVQLQEDLHYKLDKHVPSEQAVTTGLHAIGYFTMFRERLTANLPLQIFDADGIEFTPGSTSYTRAASEYLLYKISGKPVRADIDTAIRVYELVVE